MREDHTGESHQSREDAPERPATVVLYPDGPYVLRGPFRVLSHDGAEIDAGRRTVALCRCGKSRMRPFCDGTHRLANFRAAGTDESAGPARVAAAPRPRHGGAAPHRRPAPGSAGTLIRLAHETVASALDGPCSAEDRLALRLAEPMLRSACALIETRALAAPVATIPPLGPGGPAAARELTAGAITATNELRASGEDPLLETVAALLGDAMREMTEPA